MFLTKSNQVRVNVQQHWHAQFETKLKRLATIFRKKTFVAEFKECWCYALKAYLDVGCKISYWEAWLIGIVTVNKVDHHQSRQHREYEMRGKIKSNTIGRNTLHPCVETLNSRNLIFF